MKTLIARRPGAPSVLEVIDFRGPDVGPGDVMIEVRAAALNRIDLSVRAGYLLDAGLLAAADRYFFGWDVAGTVASVGPEVTRFRPGDAVIGLRDVLSAPGSHAERVVLDESAVAPAPTSVDAVTAAAFPLGALTADGSLRAAGLGRGQSLLVTGAGGVVGRLIVELARMRGIHVVAQARQADAAALENAGAHRVLAAEAGLARLVRAEHAGGIDAVIDCANLGIVAHEALRGEGRFVSLVRPFAPPPLRGTTVVVHETYADGVRLAELSALVDSGGLHVCVDRTYSLDHAAAAHERLGEGGVRGRIVLVP